MVSDLQSLANRFTSFGKGAASALGGVVKSVTSARSALLGLTAAFASSKIVGAFKGFVAEGGKLYDTARRIGTTTELLTELQYAFDQLGASSDVASSALGKLTKVV